MPDWKPAGYPSLSPYLISGRAEAAIAFMEQAFGATLLRRFDRPDGSLMHAELRIDDGVVMIGGATEGYAQAETHLHLYVPDAQATFDRAVAAGGAVVQEMSRKEDGDLRGGVSDGCGTTWWIGQQ